MKVILLDLNYTLVSNSEIKIQPFEKQIEREQYRYNLLKGIRECRVILITARPDKYRCATLKSIRTKTGWKPDEAYFNEYNLFPEPCKKRILKNMILHRYQPEELLAIESNPKTRAMYARYNIKAVTYDQYLLLFNESIQDQLQEEYEGTENEG